MDIFYLGHLRKEFALYLEEKLGASSEQIIIITTIAFQIPFSFLNYLIHDKKSRLIYSLVVGFFLQYSIYGINILHTIISTISTYLFCYYYGRKKSPFYILIGTMIHLSYLNIVRMIEDYGGWAIDDITTIYMMSVSKYSSFAFSYDDGKKELKDIVNEHHRTYRIKNMPTFLEYASYIYFYPTSVVGPYIEFRDFINFIEEKDCYQNLNSKFGYLCLEGLKKLFWAFFFIAFYSIIGTRYPMTAVGNAQFRIDYPLWWQRILYMYIAGPVARSKYYIGWLLSYSSLIFCGMAYGEREVKKEKEEKVKIIPNVDKGSYGSIMFNEFGMHPKLKMVYWNMSIHLWLKYNVYTRLITPLNNNKNLAIFITYVFSSIWHGFYPSYYINFFLIFLYEQVSVFVDELGFYKFVDKHKILWPLVSLKTTFINNSVGAFFYCLEAGAAKQILINYYGMPANITITCYIFTIIYRIIFKKKKDKKPPKEKIIEEGTKEKEKDL